MGGKELFDLHFGECPLVAIIRGVAPAEATDIGQALYDGGIRIIEVPLNSPDPFTSIRSIAEALGDKALVGAGTVVDPEDVDRVKDAGGQLVVAPNTNPRIIGATVAAGLASLPGFFTPSEAFTALACGASALKLFPAEAATPNVVKSIRAVLPTLACSSSAESRPTAFAAGSTREPMGSVSAAASTSRASRPTTRFARRAPMWTR